MSRRRAEAILCCFVTVMGCARADPSSGEPPTSRGADRAVSQQNASSSDIPDALLDAIFADLTSGTDTGRSAISVVSVESVTWSNGALGCPQPGVMYTQQLVPGYRVVLSAAGKRVAYHAAAAGHFVKCSGPILRAPPVEPPPPENPPDR